MIFVVLHEVIVVVVVKIITVNIILVVVVDVVVIIVVVVVVVVVVLDICSRWDVAVLLQVRVDSITSPTDGVECGEADDDDQQRGYHGNDGFP